MCLEPRLGPAIGTVITQRIRVLCLNRKNSVDEHTAFIEQGTNNDLYSYSKLEDIHNAGNRIRMNVAATRRVNRSQQTEIAKTELSCKRR